MTGEPDAAVGLFEDWSLWTRLGSTLWAKIASGQYCPNLTARLDEVADKAFEAENRLVATPAITLAGVTGKLRIFAYYCAKQAGEPSPEERLVLSALSDLQHMNRETL
jgi:uncharacterized protein YciW